VSISVLGASNVWLALNDVLEHLALRFEGDELVARIAHGPGRSYGLEAGIGWLRFPALSTCGLLDAVAQPDATDPSRPSYALLTDIGNDVGYSVEPEKILSWVRSTVARLRSVGAEVAITSPPVESVEALPGWKFAILRRVLFPFRRLTKSTVCQRLRTVHQGLSELATEDHITLLETRVDWYGRDAIHIRRDCRAAAFSGWIDALLDRSEDETSEDLKRERRSRLTVSSSMLRLRFPSRSRRADTTIGEPCHVLSVAPNVSLHVH
jgi:hypothetical protein